MNNFNLSSVTSRMKAPTIAVAGSLLLAAPALAHAEHGNRADRASIREMRALNPESRGRELRQMIRSQRLFVPDVQQNVAASNAASIGSNLNQSAQNIVLPNNHAQSLANISNRSQFVNDAGKSHSVTRGLELDLTSDERAIVLGDNLFAGSASYTISTGGQEKVLSAGSKVSAAEYVALQQVITGGAQSLVVDHSGRGVDGQFDLNSISDGGANLRAASLVVPQNVSAVGDFSRRADGLRVTNDLVNYGAVYAFSGNADQNTVRIAARDINNELGGLISTEVPASLSANSSTNPVNLSLNADRDINNSGSIVSSGAVELSAGSALKNSGSVRANDSISLASFNITNSGTISSVNGNVNFSGVGDADLVVNNIGGTISAVNGAIDVRSNQYTGAGNSTIFGGDLVSRELNLFSGQGSADVFVNELTGVVTSSGTATHVKSNTETLTIGSQCLTGDPTYFNNGDIVIAGDINVEEALAIIASGNITTSDTNLTISARSLATGQGFDISIIAGANIISGTTPSGGVLSGQPPLSQFATGDVTISGTLPSATGGDVNLGGAVAGLLIDASSTGTNQKGGSVTIAAFNNTAEGHIILPTTSLIQASGSGTGNNGNVTMQAGATSGNAITLGNIISRTGTGTASSTGAVFISNTQPSSSDGASVVYDTTGKVKSSNAFFPLLGTPSGSGIVSIGDIKASGSVLVAGGGLTGVGAIDASGTGLSSDGHSVALNSTNNRVIVTGLIDVSGVGSGTGGDVFVQSNSNIGPTLFQQAVLAASGSGGGKGGTITVNNLGTGGITLFNNLIAKGAAGEGSVVVSSNDGAILANSVLIDVSTGVGGKNGGIVLGGSFISVSGTQLNLQAAAVGAVGTGEIQIITTAGGIFTDGADFVAEANSKLSLTLSNNSITADGIGLGNDGGEIRLISPSIDFSSSSVTPLVLSANGDANNNGGKITFSSLKPVATVIGLPAKLPKAPVDFLQLTAKSGNANPANGGEINVAVGGSLTVVPSSTSLSVFTSTAGGDGGTITLASGGTFNKKGSPLVVIGGLNVDGNSGGDGGTIKLTTASSKDFIVGSSKAPKNGVSGILSADTSGGGGGSIAVTNTVGGVKVVSSPGLNAAKIELTGSGKGKVTTGKGVIITTTLIGVVSNTGLIDVDYSALLQIAVSLGGSVKLLNSAGSFSTVSAIAGGDFTINTGAGVNVDSVLAKNGDVNIITGPNGGSNLIVNPNGTITALNGGILLQQLGSVGSIIFENNANVQTGGQGDDVVIAFGAAPKKPLNPSPPFPNPNPALLDINPVGKGQVFFGATPGNVLTSGTIISTLNATNKNVIFNVPVGNSGLIVIKDNVTITADPPSRAGLANSLLNTQITNAMPVDLTSASRSPSTVSSMFEAGLSANGVAFIDASRVQSIATLPTDLLGSSLQTQSSGNTSSLNTASVTPIQLMAMHQGAVSTEAEENPHTNAFVWTDEDLGLNNAMMIEHKEEAKSSSSTSENHNTTGGATKFESATLRRGSVLFAPSKLTHIETPFGTVAIEKGAIAFVVIDGDKLAVYDLHDSSKGSVRVSTRAVDHVLVPGRCVVITGSAGTGSTITGSAGVPPAYMTDNAHHGFEKLNPMESVGYRSLSVHHGNGLKSFSAEFSTLHAINNVAPLQAVFGSKTEAAKRMRDRLMKTSAVLMHLNGSREDFRSYAEVSVTAMRSGSY